jgi:hypothetical protein
MTQRRQSFTRALALALALVVSTIGLSACSTDSSHSSTTTVKQSVFLCRSISRVDGLQVTRRTTSVRFVYDFASSISIHRAESARKVARALCALPVASGRVFCPAELGITYQLDFAVQGEKGLGGETVVVEPTGCALVTGIGAVRTTATTPDFYRVLASAMGLPSKDDNVTSFVGRVSVHG